MIMPQTISIDYNHEIREFEDGTRVFRKLPQRVSNLDLYKAEKGIDMSKLGNVSRIETPCGRVFEFEEYIGRLPERGILWGELWYRTGGLKLATDEKLIPITVARIGKAAIASYMWSVFDSTVEEISIALTISEKTVEQYLIDFEKRRR